MSECLSVTCSGGATPGRARQWRRPGAEFGGTEKFSWTKISEWRFFRKNISIFTAKISDDLFLVIDQIFRIFPFFSQIFRIFTMLNAVYDPFLTPSFTLFMLSRASDNTSLLLKVLGERMHGPSLPPQILGDHPPVPSGARANALAVIAPPWLPPWQWKVVIIKLNIKVSKIPWLMTCLCPAVNSWLAHAATVHLAADWSFRYAFLRDMLNNDDDGGVTGQNGIADKMVRTKW